MSTELVQNLDLELNTCINNLDTAIEKIRGIKDPTERKKTKEKLKIYKKSAMIVLKICK